MNQLVLKRRLSDVVDEYEQKAMALKDRLEHHNEVQSQLIMASTIEGTYGETSIKTSSICESDLQRNLLRSAWRYLYNKLNIRIFSSANEQKNFENFIQNPKEFTLENIRDQFGDYIADPRGKMLQALAEAFCNLDPAFKSHDKVKIGVAGLPKRIIISYFKSSSSHGYKTVLSVINAVAAYQEIPLLQGEELRDLEYGTITEFRGMRLKLFQNGNAHLFFTPSCLKDVNRALAEYYGEVLADCHEEKPTQRRAGTEVSKDLQFYPTPLAVIQKLISDNELSYHLKDKTVLEPSCGEGSMMDEIKKHGAHVYGVEVDKDRANTARTKGHHVTVANFLDLIPNQNALYDYVIMNPPFYGKHYAKHVLHAMKFLKPGGKIFAILPITARYDHKLLPTYEVRRGYDVEFEEKRNWDDLPVGSFAESGTRVNTTIYKFQTDKIVEPDRIAA